jgi:hypothetical protein
MLLKVLKVVLLFFSLMLTQSLLLLISPALSILRALLLV